MKVGQHFLSQSKIQDEPIEYVFRGETSAGALHLASATGNVEEDVYVEEAWFTQRQINVHLLSDTVHKMNIKVP